MHNDFFLTSENPKKQQNSSLTQRFFSSDISEEAAGSPVGMGHK